MVEEFLRLLLCGGQDQDTVNEIACGVYCPEVHEGNHDRYTKAEFIQTPDGLQLEVSVGDSETGEIQSQERFAISVTRMTPTNSPPDTA
jgi:hypothetical protein